MLRSTMRRIVLASVALATELGAHARADEIVAPNAADSALWNQRTSGTWMTANALEFVVRVKPGPAPGFFFPFRFEAASFSRNTALPPPPMTRKKRKFPVFRARENRRFGILVMKME